MCDSNSLKGSETFKFFYLKMPSLFGVALFRLNEIGYRKIPKISPGDYIFQRPSLRGLFLEGLIFGGAFLRRGICVSKSIGLTL